ncbi:MAG: hypothetical protein DRN99_05610 [Thermoproteota archaeon]|nr:MAG: hypothetical protein DRN99_05610 [Candidatus Korarchaeota archaeon]
MAYCTLCLRNAVERSIKKTIRRLELLSPTDRIIALVRPCVEDICFLSLFLEIESEFRMVKVKPLLAVPSSPDYDLLYSTANSICKAHKIELHRVKIPSSRSCLSCTSNAMNMALKIAKRANYNKIVMPVTLDEYCSLALAYPVISQRDMRPLRGLLLSALPQSSNRHLALPAIEVLSAELIAAVQIPETPQACSMKSSSWIGKLRRLLLDLEGQRAGSLMGLLRTLQKIGSLLFTEAI